MELSRKQLLDQMDSLFADLQARANDLSPILNTISEIIESAILENFRQYGRWDGDSKTVDLFSGGKSKWKDLSGKTKERYKAKGIAPLKRTLRRTGDLYNSINVSPKPPTQISIRMSSPYGAAHNFGFKGKVNVKQHLRKVKSSDGEKEVQVRDHTRLMDVPASPFLTLTDDDILEIVNYLEGELY